MKQVISAIIAAAAGAAVAYGITSTVGSATSCFDGSCVATIGDGIPFIIGGSLAFIVAVVLWWGAWLVGPVVGLGVAAYTIIADGGSIDPGSALTIALPVLIGPAILAVILIRSRGKAKAAEHLVQTGQKAVAHVQGARETGVFINNRPQIRVSYLIQPLDGRPAFPHEKTQTLGYTEIPPRPGLAWPAWYDPTAPDKVAIGAPSGAALDAQTEQLLSEFGLTVQQAYGYDPRGGAAPAAFAGPQGAPVAAAPAPQTHANPVAGSPATSNGGSGGWGSTAWGSGAPDGSVGAPAGQPPTSGWGR